MANALVANGIGPSVAGETATAALAALITGIGSAEAFCLQDDAASVHARGGSVRWGTVGLYWPDEDADAMV